MEDELFFEQQQETLQWRVDANEKSLQGFNNSLNNLIDMMLQWVVRQNNITNRYDVMEKLVRLKVRKRRSAVVEYQVDEEENAEEVEERTVVSTKVVPKEIPNELPISPILSNPNLKLISKQPNFPLRFWSPSSHLKNEFLHLCVSSPFPINTPSETNLTEMEHWIDVRRLMRCRFNGVCVRLVWHPPWPGGIPHPLSVQRPHKSQTLSLQSKNPTSSSFTFPPNSNWFLWLHNLDQAKIEEYATLAKIVAEDVIAIIVGVISAGAVAVSENREDWFSLVAMHIDSWWLSVVLPLCMSLKLFSMPKNSSISESLAYKGFDVDIDVSSELVHGIAKMVSRIGGSYLLVGKHGVRTKLKLVFETGIQETIGVDLVAMSVNNIVTSGLFFLNASRQYLLVLLLKNSPLSIEVSLRGIDLKGRRQITAWVEYGEAIEIIRVWLGYWQIRPLSPILVFQIYLSNPFKKLMHVGFSVSSVQDSYLVVRICKDVESRSQAGSVDFGPYELFNYFVEEKGKGRMEAMVIGEVLKMYTARWSLDFVDALGSTAHAQWNKSLVETIICLLPSDKGKGKRAYMVVSSCEKEKEWKGKGDTLSSTPQSMPIIEQFNHAMPTNCAGGNLGVAREPELKEWTARTIVFNKLQDPVRIAMVGKYTGLSSPYLSVLRALLHAYVAWGWKLIGEWVATCDLEDKIGEEIPYIYKTAWNCLNDTDRAEVVLFGELVGMHLVGNAFTVLASVGVSRFSKAYMLAYISLGKKIILVFDPGGWTFEVSFVSG